MPKQYIDDSYAEFRESGVRVKVGWSKEAGDVQIATVAADGAALEALELLPGSNGWFVNLDRQGLNRLIRTLRKARDDAFGRDE